MLPELKQSQIIDRGRGPEIVGTRITVYNVLDFRKIGWDRDRIAAHFSLSSEQVQAALDYIVAHQEDVEAEYGRILERAKNYTYPPDVQAIVDTIRARADKRLQEIKARRQANGDDGSDSVRS